MTAWKELPQPSTPGPWEVVGAFEKGGLGVEQTYQEPLPSAVIYPPRGSFLPPLPQDAAAIAALPDWIEEALRLRAWVDHFDQRGIWFASERLAIRAGEWPEGSKP